MNLLKVKKRNLKPPKSHPSAGENQTNGASTSITESKKNNTWCGLKTFISSKNVHKNTLRNCGFKGF
jgi:hypothetical protein